MQFQKSISFPKNRWKNFIFCFWYKSKIKLNQIKRLNIKNLNYETF